MFGAIVMLEYSETSIRDRTVYQLVLKFLLALWKFLF